MSLEARKGPICAAFSGLSLDILLLLQVVGREDLIRSTSIICCLHRLKLLQIDHGKITLPRKSRFLGFPPSTTFWSRRMRRAATTMSVNGGAARTPDYMFADHIAESDTLSCRASAAFAGPSPDGFVMPTGLRGG